jgi:RNA polymerase sigma factor (sigma-70 family)
MANSQLDGVLTHIRKLVAGETAGPRPDRELVERFVRHRDEAAFAALVQRHGPMVLGVCRRVLHHTQDAEDACQAAFLVFARKAASIRNRDAIGSWLHGVAYRAAARLRRDLSRRRAREGPVADVPQADSAELTWREVRQVLDEELQHLPERFRAPLLLCYLEGKTRDEAAQELGWSLGALRGRLERGRDLLRARLTRRGVTLSGALLASLLAQQTASAALPAALVVSLVQAAPQVAAGQAPAAGLFSAHVIAVMEGGLKAMLMTKLKITTALVLVVGLAGFGAGLWANAGLAPVSAEAQEPVPSGLRPAVVQASPSPASLSGAGNKQEQPSDPWQLARNQAASRLNLKQIALAMHNYHDVNGHFPAPAIYSGLTRTWSTGGAGPAAPAGPRPGRPGMGPIGPGVGGPGPGGLPGRGSMRPGGPVIGGPTGAAGAETGSLPLPVVGSSGLPIVGSQAGKNIKPLLSWRVELLPYLEQDALYQQFKRDEPWDSPHNLKLLKYMPKVYAPPGVTTRTPYTTYYQVFVGKGAAFEKQHLALLPQSFPDGTSNTILVVEAGSPVPWTKPEDLHFAADEPLPELGGLFPNVFNAAFADGAVYTLSKKADPEMLRRAIVRDDGLPVDLEKLKAPASRREADLKAQNQRLKAELVQQQESLEALQQEKEILLEMVEDPTVKALKEENAGLEQNLRTLREQTEALKREIQSLRQRSEKPRPEKGKK